MDFQAIIEKIHKQPMLISLTLLTLSACGGGGNETENNNTITTTSSTQLLSQYSGRLESAPLSEADIYPLYNYISENTDTLLERSQSRSLLIAKTQKTLNTPKATIVNSTSETGVCTNGGTLSTSISIDETTGIGSTTSFYDDCDDGVTITSGEFSINFNQWNDDWELTNYQLIYKNFRIENKEDNSFNNSSGDVSFTFSESSLCKMIVVSSLLVETEQLNIFNQNLKTTTSSCNDTKEISISGRVYFSYLGYLDINTHEVMQFNNIGQLLSGQLTFSNLENTLVFNTVDGASTVKVENNQAPIKTLNAPSWYFTHQPFDDESDNDNDGYPNIYDSYPENPKFFEEATLLIPQKAVALSSFPSVGKQTHEIDILSNVDSEVIEWTATTEADWLTITASGTTNNKLIINAHSNELNTDSFYQTTISVRANGLETESVQNINVGLWVGSNTPESESIINDISYENYEYAATDPLRPYVYLHTGKDSISIFHIYKRTLINTIDNVGSMLRDMEVSADGRNLYVADITDERASEDYIHIINLENLDDRSSWQPSDSLTAGFTLSETNNKTFLFSGLGNVYAADTGKIYIDTIYGTYRQSNYFDANLFGNKLCGMTSNAVRCFDLTFNTTGDQLKAIPTEAITSIGGGSDIAINHDGSLVYTASGYQNFPVISTDTMTVESYLYSCEWPSAVEIGPDNSIHGTCSSIDVDANTFIYENDHRLRYSDRLVGDDKLEEPITIAVSGDGMVSIVPIGFPTEELVSRLNFIYSY